MIRRPQISTLFPYTTLFRSLNCVAQALLGVNEDAFARGILTVPQRLVESAPRRGELRTFPPPLILFPSAFELALDRKSTRLNSSHSQISYAVFCLNTNITKH